MIHVCSLAPLHEPSPTGARHVVTLLANVDQVERPASVSRPTISVSMDDITEAIDGFVAPAEEHVDQVLNFVRGWDRARRW